MSYQAVKYDEQVFETLWQSIKPNGGITLGTLFHHAKKQGWVGMASLVEAVEDAKDILNARLFAESQRDKMIFIASLIF